MRLATVASHTFDDDALPRGALVLDAGCRYFDFTDEMQRRGHRVLPLDCDPDVVAPRPGAVYAALVGEDESRSARFIQAGVGSRIVFDNIAFPPVPTTTMSALVAKHGRFDLAKLDIEGSEYGVLLTWPGPVTGQVTVEFHEPTGLGRAVHGEDVYERIIAHMGQWYHLAQHEGSPFDGGTNYYDTLWVLR